MITLLCYFIIKLCIFPERFLLRKKLNPSNSPTEELTSVKKYVILYISRIKKEPFAVSAKFVIKSSRDGQFYFNLYAPNGRVIATSETYTTLQNCKKGAESVKKNARAHIEDTTLENPSVLTHPKFVLFIDKAEKFRFNLKASNGEVVSISQGYTTKSSALGGIESIAENAPEAAVEIETTEAEE